MKTFFSVLFSVPSFFVGISIIALNQGLATGLAVLLASLVAQIILGGKLEVEEDFAWDRFHSLSFHGCEIYEIKEKLHNIYSNLVKIWTVWAVLFLVLNNYDFKSSFGQSGLIIFGLVSVIVLGLVMRRKYDGSYEKFRAFLSVATLIVIIVFIYLYFATQLIWLSVLMFIALAFITEDFEELNFGQNTSFVFLFLFCLTAVVSTIYQFWHNIGLAMQNAWNYLFSFDFSHPIWLVIGLIVLAVAIMILVRYIRSKRVEKMALAAIALEEARQLALQKEKRAKEKSEEEAAKAKTQEELKEISASLQDGSISAKQLIFLAKHRDLYLGKITMEPLTQVNPEDFFLISKIKKQIIFDNGLSDVVGLFNYLYRKSYHDEELRVIIKWLQKLHRFIDDYKDFQGYQAFKDMMTQNTRDIPDQWCPK